MKFLQFAAKVARIAESPSVVRRDPELTIKIHRPGSLGPTPSVEVDDIYAGFDWDAGQVMLYPKQQLTALDPEQVCAIEESVRKGQSWHAYQAHKKHRGEIKAVEDQRDTLLAALHQYEKAFHELFAQCCSNPVFNTWGQQVNMAELNEAHSNAVSVLSKIKGEAI